MKELLVLTLTVDELREFIQQEIKEALSTSMVKVWMNEKEAQAYTGFSHYTLHNARADGELKATKCNRLVRYHRDDLDSWMRSKQG